MTSNSGRRLYLTLGIADSVNNNDSTIVSL